ncbi:hypothetical protein GCM10027598_24610 [Amycolatopsis oliviviridis]|uniref:Uncharacterized protein n=1 Tax=Amycolatopsis oliviviridis TaxID=1471590 RepID=A0ABQ3LIH6_9PSEU|nr:hypothetical protein GCM10017790_32250 [Amycolatopsis oliviviridis]
MHAPVEEADLFGLLTACPHVPHFVAEDGTTCLIRNSACHPDARVSFVDLLGRQEVPSPCPPDPASS